MYTVAIVERNSWNRDGSLIVNFECGHKHRTLTGANRCLSSLSFYHKDGTHNAWAHYGEILHDRKRLSADEYDELTLIEYRRYNRANR